MDSEHLTLVHDLFNDMPYRHYSAKQIIIHPGDNLERAYLLVKGYIRIYHTPNGKQRTLMLLGPGDTFPVIASETAVYSYEALTDCIVVYGKYSILLDRVINDDRYLEMSRQTSAEMSRRLAKRLEIMGTVSTSKRLYELLKHLGEIHGEDASDGWRRICVKLTQQELGNQIGITRERTSTIFNELVLGGMVKVDEDGLILVRVAEEQPMKQ